jgi:hypothetical protein
VTSKSRTTYNESVRRESTSLKRGILVSVRLCCIHWHMGKERRKEEFLPLCFWSVLDTTRKLVEKMGKRDASCALHGVFILLLLLFFSSVSVLFCSYNACVTLHHDPARSKSDLLVQTCWNRRGRRSLLRIYISLGPGIPREKEHGRYITHTVQFELHNLPVSIKLVFRLIL